MLHTIILAAGKGTRMKSNLAKVLHHLAGKPLLSYVIEAAKMAGSQDISVVIGYQADAVRKRFSDGKLTFIEQFDQLGTGHAVLQARERFRMYSGPVLILCGDVPLLQASTLRSLVDRHRQSKAAVTVLTTFLADPTGYGRIVKGPGAEIIKIVEERDATEVEKEIKEINTGIYCAESRFLFDALCQIDNSNAQKEYYLTDIVAIAREDGKRVAGMAAFDSREVMGINTPQELAAARGCLENGKKPRRVRHENR